MPNLKFPRVFKVLLQVSNGINLGTSRRQCYNTFRDRDPLFTMYSECGQCSYASDNRQDVETKQNKSQDIESRVRYNDETSK